MANTVDKSEFHWADYVVFVSSLVITAGLGLFMSLWKRKNSSTEELLLASRSMHFIPVCLSMTASLMNAALILGGPADIYFFGPTGMMVILGFNLIPPVVAFVVVPTFYKMNLTSAYEYLERRFNFAVRIVGSFVFSLSLLLFLSVVLYAPALAFSQVTSLSLPVAIVVTGGICTLYTMLGGIKAVIWTDSIQMVILIVGLIVLAAVGSNKVGGFGEVWDIAKATGRDEFFEWSWDPRVRYTFGGQVIGQWVIYTGIFFSNQMMIQRYMTVTSVRDAQISIFLTFLMFSVFIVMVAMIGWIMYAYYTTDPLLSGRITKGDMIVPLFLMDVLGDKHGLTGLITAAVFAAALSSVSSAVNSLAAVTLEDFVKPGYQKVYKSPLPDRMATFVTIGLACTFGILTIGLSFAAEYTAEVLIEATAVIWSVVGGPLAGVFIMGFFFPWVNSAGALCGMLTSLAMSLWIGVGGIMYKIQAPLLPLRFKGKLINPPAPDFSNPPGGDLQDFYQLSFTWYATYAIGICLIVGNVVSVVSRLFEGGYFRLNCKSKKDSKLYYNCVDKCYCYCPESVKDCMRCGVNFDDSKEFESNEFTYDAKNGDLTDKVGVCNPAFEASVNTKF